MKVTMKAAVACLSLCLSTASAGLIFPRSLPVVDLGYGLWQATLNQSGSVPYYNFSNIRYAEPPLGALRFQAPTAVTTTNRTTNNGQQGAICPQGYPAWFRIENEYLAGVPLSTIESQNSGGSPPTIPPPDATTSEDCLLMDIIVPKSIYNLRKVTLAPVLVWIYGGGYTSGSKWGSGNPATLVARAKDYYEPGMIFVTFNYRLGLFGFLGGETFQASGAANAGLLDQRFALEWIQTNIHLFGGDKTRVTVMGESAGAGSILHQITAYGGANGPVPFKQAIMQSTAFIPQPADSQLETQLQQTLKTASHFAGTPITTVAQLQALPFAQLYQTNYAVIAASLYGDNTYGPSIDGSFVPALPGVLLAAGQFNKGVKIMVGHNVNEGYIFSDPMISNDTAYENYMAEQFPAATNGTIADIVSLYPSPNDTDLYDSQLNRLALTISDFVFLCNSRYLHNAFLNQTYGYSFAVPPGFHGVDLAYTFFNGDTTSLDFSMPVNVTVATTLQHYISNFVRMGNPNGLNVPYFPMYGSAATVVNVNITNLGAHMTDSAIASAQRCSWWQSAQDA